MPPKRRAGENPTSNKPKKMPKLAESDENVKEVDFDKKKREELEYALNTHDSERVLELSLEFIKMQTAFSKLAIRLLSFFIKANNQQLVRKLLKQQNLDFKTPQTGGLLLWRAVKQGRLEMAKMLIRAGADLNVRESNENSTILHAVLTSCQIEDQGEKENLALLMLEYGAEVDAVDNDGCSILHRALESECSMNFIKKLLQQGANVRITNSTYLNDIYYALRYKSELLLELIQHQVPDQETRNKRGVIAIEYLISEQLDGKLQRIRNILDLGVPVNSPDPKNPLGIRNYSLLHYALRAKKIDVIKLLLEYGADVHEKGGGCTPLYEAAVLFKGFSDASRLLISHGASINQRNNDGSYPIHGACRNESLRNVHLFLSLGANLAVIDNNGFTPFDSMKIKNIELTDAGRLVIKHFALMTSKGIPVLEKDLKKVSICYDVQEFYNSCLEELEGMKKEKVVDNTPYFSLLSDNTYDMLLLVQNANFVKAFNDSQSKAFELFPIYFYNLEISFRIAQYQFKIFEPVKKLLGKVFIKIFPNVVIQKIAYYASLKKMIDCKKSSYLVLHKNTKHNASGKRILI